MRPGSRLHALVQPQDAITQEPLLCQQGVSRESNAKGWCGRTARFNGYFLP